MKMFPGGKYYQCQYALQPLRKCPTYQLIFKNSIAL